MSRIEEAMEKRAGAAGGADRALARARPESETLPSDRILRPAAAGTVDERIVAFHDPRSGLTENFKQIRIVIQNMLPEGVSRIIMFTSSYRAEGKTTASLNFAAAVAQDPSKRVLMMDADMREPRVGAFLGTKARHGFSDLLTSDAPVESVVVATPIPGLSAILAGDLPRNPSELIGTERARQVFAELKEKYDYVVVDTPPVLPVVDTVRMGALADGVVLIVEAAKTSRRRIRRAVQLLNDANASIMGFLLNKDQTASVDRYATRYYRAE